MAIKANFPDIKPSLNLDFANTKRLDPRITFTRASTATYYDGKTVAKAEENLFTYSQEFDNAAWVKKNSGSTAPVVVANNSTAPDGTTTAETVSFGEIDAAGEFSVIDQTITVSLNEYTFSVWVKANSASDEGEKIWIYLNDGSFTLQSHTLTSTWVRLSLTETITNTTLKPSVGVLGSTFGGENQTAVSVDIWGAQLEQRSSVTAYTPTTTQPITNYIPVLQSAASGEARFDHDPVTGESLGLLVEEQRTNLLTYSEDFSDSDWVKTDTTVAANTTAAPDGTLTADTLTANAGTFGAAPRVFQNNANGDPRTLSIYAKAGSYNFVKISPRSFGGVGGIVVNLTTGQITATAIGTPPTATSVVSAGNGWWRISLSTTSTGTARTVRVALSEAAIGDADGGTYTGNEFIFLWGAQLEAGAFPTSYIPTTSATVTRAADAASMTGTNFSSWYRADEGTLYAQVSALSGRSIFSGRYYEANDGTNNNRIACNSGTTANAFVTYQDVTQFSVSPTATASNKTALAYKVNDFAFSLNGATALTDTSGNIPAVTFFAIGSNAPNAGGQANGYFKKLAYYPARLTNDELQGLTS
jgi:hypothetical protein